MRRKTARPTIGDKEDYRANSGEAARKTARLTVGDNETARPTMITI